MKPAFIPATGLSAVSGTPVGQNRPGLDVLRPSSSPTSCAPRGQKRWSAPTMVSYPYTGSGYGGCGVPYANNKVGQFMLKTESSDIIDTLASIPVFSTLSSLLKSTGLDYELKKGGPFTIFAPTDDAFTALLEPHSFTVYRSLLRPENKKDIVPVLLFHVLPGELTAAGVVPLGGKVTAPTLNGEVITVMNYNRRVTAGSAKVVRSDIECSNGLIHIIDSVLTPMSFDPPPVTPAPQLYPNSIVSDVYGKMITPSMALGIEPYPESAGALPSS